MNKQEEQYFVYLTKLGYTPKFYPEKSMFYIEEHNLYLKCCEYSASDQLKQYAAEASKKANIVLLEGNLTFRDYPTFQDGYFVDCWCVLMHKGSKYAPFFYGEFHPDYFEHEAYAIACGINGKDITCKRCGRVNDYKIDKNVHYKATCKCGGFLTNISTNKPLTIHFGKYAGRQLDSMTDKDELQYLQWACDNNVFTKKLKEAALSLIQSI